MVKRIPYILRVVSALTIFLVMVYVTLPQFASQSAKTIELKDFDIIRKIATEKLPIVSNSSKPEGSFVLRYDLRGMIFDGNTKPGDLSSEISTKIAVSVVKSFSRGVENHVKDIFNDEYKECQFYALMPAMMRRDGNIYIVQRIWLAQYVRTSILLNKMGRAQSDMNLHWNNTWQENYFYEMEVDEDYNLLRPGRILGLPTPTNNRYSYRCDGPMDPRLFSVNGEPYLAFHSWLKDGDYSLASRVQIYSLSRQQKMKLTLPIPLLKAEINWIPLELNDEMYFTYSIDPLRVIKCDKNNGSCAFVYEQQESSKNPFDYNMDHLRGGTPWTVYRYPYYIGIGHNVIVSKSPVNGKIIYNANIIVLCINPWRVVYTSRLLEFNGTWLNSEPVIRNETILFPFFYPNGIIKWSDDIIDVSGHLSDASGHVLRIKGIKHLMDLVIEKDQSNIQQTNPSTRFVQQYILESYKSFKQGWTFYGDLSQK